MSRYSPEQNSTHLDFIEGISNKYLQKSPGFEDIFEQSHESFRSIDQVIVVPLDQEMIKSNNKKGSQVQQQSQIQNSQFRGGSTYQTQTQQNQQSQPQNSYQQKPNQNNNQYSSAYQPKQEFYSPPVSNNYLQKQDSQSYQQSPRQQDKPKIQQVEYEQRNSIQNQDDIPEVRQIIEHKSTPSQVMMRKSNMDQEKKQLLTTGYVKQRIMKPYKGPQILNIVSYNQQGQVVINEDLYDVLGDVGANVYLITVGGMPFSGKSFVLNNIMELPQKDNFNNCSEGIWLHTQPIFNNGKNYYFMESSGGIFNTVAVIISSLFVFNILGDLDKESLSSVVDISKLVDQKSIALLSYMTPDFIWLLRDNAPPQMIQENSQFNSLFKIKEVIILPPPSSTVKEMAQISKLKADQLSREFTSQLLTLKNRILNKALSKQLNGVAVNGRMSFTLIESVCQSINSRSMDFSKIWLSVSENETKEAYNQSIDICIKALRTFFQDDQPKSFEDFQSIMKNVRDAVHEQFRQISGMDDKNSHYKQYLEKLDQIVDQKERQALQLNEEIAASSNEDTLKEVSKDLTSKMSQQLYSSNNITDFVNDFNCMLDSYNTLGIGMDKSYSLVQYLIAFYQPLIRNLFDNCRFTLANNNDQDDFAQQEEYFVNKLHDLRERQNQLENQIDKKSKGIITLQQNTSNLDGEIQEKQKELQTQQIQLQNVPQLKQEIALKDQEIQKLKQQLISVQKKKKTGCFG